MTVDIGVRVRLADVEASRDDAKTSAKLFDVETLGEIVGVRVTEEEVYDEGVSRGDVNMTPVGLWELMPLETSRFDVSMRLDEQLGREMCWDIAREGIREVGVMGGVLDGGALKGELDEPNKPAYGEEELHEFIIEDGGVVKLGTREGGEEVNLCMYKVEGIGRA